MCCQVAVEDIIADGRLRLAVQPVFDETQLAAALQVLPLLPHPCGADSILSVMFALPCQAHADQHIVCRGVTSAWLLHLHHNSSVNCVVVMVHRLFRFLPALQHLHGSPVMQCAADFFSGNAIIQLQHQRVRR